MVTQNGDKFCSTDLIARDTLNRIFNSVDSIAIQRQQTNLCRNDSKIEVLQSKIVAAVGNSRPIFELHHSPARACPSRLPRQLSLNKTTSIQDRLNFVQRPHALEIFWQGIVNVLRLLTNLLEPKSV